MCYMKKKLIPANLVVYISLVLIFLVCVYIFNFRSIEKSELFDPIDINAEEIYTFRVSKEAKLEGIVDNLKYYGFIKDEKSLIYALEHSQDNTQGSKDYLTVGENSIDLEAEYKISPNMDTWQIANILLNEGSPQDCSHGCPPGLFYPEKVPYSN